MPDLDITRVESVADGPGVVPVINNLIAKGSIPPLVAVFSSPRGRVTLSAPRSSAA